MPIKYAMRRYFGLLINRHAIPCHDGFGVVGGGVAAGAAAGLLLSAFVTILVPLDLSRSMPAADRNIPNRMNADAATVRFCSAVATTAARPSAIPDSVPVIKPLPCLRLSNSSPDALNAIQLEMNPPPSPARTAPTRNANSSTNLIKKSWESVT